MSTFESGFYKAIDFNLAAQSQYGPAAIAVQNGEHLYDWQAMVNGQAGPLDLNRAVADQYGAGYILVHTGVQANDWAAVRFADLSLYVLPVLLIASDRFYEVTGVQTGVSRLSSVMGYVQDWYAHHVAEGFRLLKPLAISSDYTSAEWDALSDITDTGGDKHRADLYNAAVQEYEQRLPVAGASLRVVLVPYPGESAAKWLGAAGIGSYAVAPQRASSVSCPAFSPTGTLTAECADAIYAVGHEMGHTWGLDHTCDVYKKVANCRKSLMAGAKPPAAILISQEVTALRASPFFT